MFDKFVFSLRRHCLLSNMKIYLVAATCILGAAIGDMHISAANEAAQEDPVIAKSLATMLRAGRTVISRNQDKINDPDLGDKGLDGKTVLQEAIKIYAEVSHTDLASIERSSRHGQLLAIEMDAISEVMDFHQQTINRQGVGFKGFIPAVFSRMVTEAFDRRAAHLAEIKVTAPPNLLRNTKAKADEWENMVISEKLLSQQWPKNESFSDILQVNGKTAYRTVIPEYYSPSCMSCHGEPAGEIDVTGYPKEGAKAGDLGGLISITLYR